VSQGNMNSVGVGVCVCVGGEEEEEEEDILHNSVLFDMDCSWGEGGEGCGLPGQEIKRISEYFKRKYLIFCPQQI